MKNVNQKRKYSRVKWCGDKGMRFVLGTAHHDSTEKYVESLGATIRTGGEDNFVKKDRLELARLQIEKNRRKLEDSYKLLSLGDGFVARQERLCRESLKSLGHRSGDG